MIQGSPVKSATPPFWEKPYVFLFFFFLFFKGGPPIRPNMAWSLTQKADQGVRCGDSISGGTVLSLDFLQGSEQPLPFNRLSLRFER